MKKNYKFAIRPYYGWDVFLFMILIVLELCFAVIISEISGVANTVLRVLFIILPIIYIAFYLYSMLWGWNARIYFDDEKAYRKIRGKTYEWYYDDMIDVEIKMYRTNYGYAARIRITSSKQEKLLTFEPAKIIIKKFVSVCTNAEIKYKLLYIIEKKLNIKLNILK